MQKQIMSESVNGFGFPVMENLQEAKRVNYKGLLSDLMAAVETHMQVMDGSAPEGTEDPLQAVLAATKEALEPKDDEGAEAAGGEEPGAETEEEPAAE